MSALRPSAKVRGAERNVDYLWHVLDANSIWIEEFSAALNAVTSVVGWISEISWSALVRRGVTDGVLEDPILYTCKFHLPRGYARPPLSWFVRLGDCQVSRMATRSEHPDRSPLICTTPYDAPVAEKWPGPVVYYLTDLTKAYHGANPKRVCRLDQRMCRAATLICPNSRRIADYLEGEAGCPKSKVMVLPNATRQANILPAPPDGPAPLPYDIAHLRRPVVGVIGNLGANMDWRLIYETIVRNPDLSWVFVGPLHEPIFNPAQRNARAQVLRLNEFAFCTGAKQYRELRDYARSFDVAFLPYQPRKEPTYSGSSTRFYEHLAACRPMIATRGFEELLHKELLVTLVDEPETASLALSRLRETGFNDGYEELRWRVSRRETWEYRAAAIRTALLDRIS